MTFAYTGKAMSRTLLLNIADSVNHFLALNPLTIDRAGVNSFHWEKHNRQRRDVLLYLSEESAAVIHALRKTHNIPERPGQPEVHVTHKVDCGSAEEAEAVAASLRSLLPLKLTYTGTTID